MANSTRSYDISSAEAIFSSKTYNNKRFLVRVGVVGSACFAVITAILGWAILNERGGLFQTENHVNRFVFLIVGMALVGFAIWLTTNNLRHGGRGPTKVDIGPDGFRVYWNDGGSKSWAWTKRGLSLNFRTRNPSVGPDVVLIYVGSTNNFVAITQEAFAGILSSARAAGVQVHNFDRSPYKLVVLDHGGWLSG